MNNITKFLMSVAAVSSLSGCIGQSESSCPGIEKGVLCMGPRAIMEATNNHDDLKYLKKEGDDSATGRAVPKETGSKCWP